MQQNGSSMFHTVVHCHKLDEVEYRYTLCNCIILAIAVPKLSNLMKI